MSNTEAGIEMIRAFLFAIVIYAPLIVQASEPFLLSNTGSERATTGAGNKSITFKGKSHVRPAANENIPVAELAKSFGRHGESPKVLATSATVGEDSSAARLMWQKAARRVTSTKSEPMTPPPANGRRRSR